MKRRICYSCFAAVTLVAILYGWAYFGGRDYGGTRGSRTFFSPDTLEIKYQTELLCPEFGFPLYRSSFTYARQPFADYLIAKGYWSPLTINEPRWVYFYGWNDRSSLGYAPLSRQFSKNRVFWKDWTEKNPESAQELWPRVLAQLRAGSESWHVNYVDEVLQILNTAESYAEFKKQLQEFDHELTQYFPLRKDEPLRFTAAASSDE